MRNIRDNSKSALTSSTGEIMSLKSVSASGRVSGLLLDMTVRQTYRNDTGKMLETVYTFPLAWGGVLLGLNVEIAGKRLTGVVMERKEAEHRYEEAVSDGDSPILLEQSSDGLFTVNLGNLKPGEEAVIEYHYAQLLNYEQNRVRVSVPTTIAPRYGDAERQGGIRPHEAVDADPLVEYPLELTLTLTGDLAKGAVQSPSHSISTRCENGQLVVALARNAYLDRDFVLTVDGLAGRSLATIAADGEGSVMLASFCPKISGSLRTAIGLKIMIDCSGSMAGDSINAARLALHQVLAELNPTDRFSYSRFGSNVEHAFDMLVPADDRHMRKASLFIDRTDADMGGTETEGALRSVFDLRHEDGETDGMDVLLITDGEVWNIEGIIDAARQSGHRIFAVGVGSAPAETLLRQMAEETGGACELVGPNEEIEAAIVRMFRRIRLPRANNLTVDWHTTPKWTTALPGALFDGETVHVFAGFEMIPQEPPVLSYAVDRSDKGMVVAPGLSHTEDDVLARLAASVRLKQLPVASGLELSLQYQLVTRQTSLFLVHLREAEDKSGDLPHLQKIAHMQAAGWGGMGSVTAFTGGSNWNVGEVPEVKYSRRRNTTLAGARDSGTLDTPAFLRRPADDFEPDNYAQADLMSSLEQLLEVVNKRLTHPDDLSSLIRAIKVYQEKFHPLIGLAEEIKSEAPNPDEAWVVFIAWADQQVGPVHKLTRHAARAMRALVGAIPENRLAAIMALLDAQMEKLSSDGWPQRPDQACSQVDANVLPDILTVVATLPG
jgi:Ca-activated chloride channel family protein